MAPGELVHRGRTALRDRFAPPAYARWTAREAYDRLFSGDATAIVRESPLRGVARFDMVRPEHVPGTIAAARALADGHWSLFGRHVTLADPPLWDRDPLSGGAWSDLPAERVDYRGGAPKPVWELGRLTMLPTLALAARVSGDRAASTRAARWLEDWTARHALGRGVHMTSGIEMAIRVLTATWTLMLLDEPVPSLEAVLGLTAQQALHVRDHLSLVCRRYVRGG